MEKGNRDRVFNFVLVLIVTMCGKVTSVSLGDVIAKGTVLVDPNNSLVQTAQAISTYVGEL